MFYRSQLAAPSTPLFTGARAVNDYMQDYANRSDLRRYIHFDSLVVSATWDQSITQWKVIYQSKSQNDHIMESVSFFDHLLVANGHYRHPFTPEVNGLQSWASSESRSYMHSIWYRNPEPYRDLSVLIIGGGRSGIDLSEEISKVAKRTVHSVRSLSDQDFEHIIQRGAISHFSPDGSVSFVNGKREYVDRIVFATGYQYDCSFLKQLPVHAPTLSSDHLYNSRFHIFPLALHTFPLRAAFPPTSLAFIGVPSGVIVFTLVEAQATLAARQMSGKISLDFDHELSETLDRNKQLRLEHNNSSLDVARAWHNVHEWQFDFLDFLWKRAGDTRRIPTWTRDLMPDGYLMRAEWQELGRLGLSESWVAGVGEGGIQEWVELMRRVIKRAKDKQHRASTLLI